MVALVWIVVGGLLMSAIATVGGLTTLLPPATLERILLPIVALAAGTLLGGAFFHMVPEGTQSLTPFGAAAWLVGGFTVFLALEQFLHWHHSHRAPAKVRKPVTYLILIGDGAHNFLGGLGIASTFLIDPQAGVIAWFAAAAHEVPQELGDFGVLVHGGWPRHSALFWNVVSVLTFPIGGVLAYLASRYFDVAPLVLFGAGNFIYIAASDLIPEIKTQTSLRAALLNFILLVLGLALMFVLAYWFGP
jgi:zinc and cadmium transporter